MLTQLAVSALFYDLLKPVNRSLARITTIIGLTGGGIKTLARPHGHDKARALQITLVSSPRRAD